MRDLKPTSGAGWLLPGHRECHWRRRSAGVGPGATVQQRAAGSASRRCAIPSCAGYLFCFFLFRGVVWVRFAFFYFIFWHRGAHFVSQTWWVGPGSHPFRHGTAADLLLHSERMPSNNNHPGGNDPIFKPHNCGLLFPSTSPSHSQTKAMSLK